MSVFSNCKFWVFFLASMYVIPLCVGGVSYYFNNESADGQEKSDYPDEVFGMGNVLISSSFALVILITASVVDYMGDKSVSTA